MTLDREELRTRLGRARLILLFTPELCRGEPLEVLRAAAGEVDVVQVRPKPAGDAARSAAPAEARAAFDWTLRVLEAVARLGARAPLVMVDDRPDVARALADRGCAGVHLGQDDTPPRIAREYLGDAPLIGFSTHSLEQVAQAQDEPADYLGFGPVHATATKGYARGLGPQAARAAAAASRLPVFAIGGITLANARELAPVGRAAASSAILAASDPAAAARALRALLARESG